MDFHSIRQNYKEGLLTLTLLKIGHEYQAIYQKFGHCKSGDLRLVSARVAPAGRLSPGENNLLLNCLGILQAKHTPPTRLNGMRKRTT